MWKSSTHIFFWTSLFSVRCSCWCWILTWLFEYALNVAVTLWALTLSSTGQEEGLLEEGKGRGEKGEGVCPYEGERLMSHQLQNSTSPLLSPIGQTTDSITMVTTQMLNILSCSRSSTSWSYSIVLFPLLFHHQATSRDSYYLQRSWSIHRHRCVVICSEPCIHLSSQWRRQNLCIPRLGLTSNTPAMIFSQFTSTINITHFATYLTEVLTRITPRM